MDEKKSYDLESESCFFHKFLGFFKYIFLSIIKKLDVLLQHRMYTENYLIM